MEKSCFHANFILSGKTKQINKASLPIGRCCTACTQWRSTAARARFHFGPACLSAIPSLMVIFNLFFPWSHLGQMEHALKHVLGVKLHSWLAFLASGMRAVRRYQGDSSQEDILTHHCLRLFCEDWSSVNNAVPVASSHKANSSSSLQCRAKKRRHNFKFMSREMFCLCSFPTGIDSRTLYTLSHFIFLCEGISNTIADTFWC